MAQGNALGGEGLTQLCPGIAACATLVELNLRAVGITDQHQDAVRRFADIVSCHEALQVVNLDGNLVGANILHGRTTWAAMCMRVCIYIGMSWRLTGTSRQQSSIVQA